ncbi:TPA: LysR family transcriptional regulator [Enterobacter ludwigii]
MLDGMSIDQLRTFIAAVDEGSFSAAGRKLRRAQSVVSATLANLESQVGFPLFERTGRYPKLTEAGAAPYWRPHAIRLPEWTRLRLRRVSWQKAWNPNSPCLWM